MRKNLLLLLVLCSCCLAGCDKDTTTNESENTTANVSTGDTTKEPEEGPENAPESSMTTTQDGIVFSKDSGVYADEFFLDIATKDNYTLFYTLDGSNPEDSETAIKFQYTIPITKRDGDENVVSAVSTSLFCSNFNDYSKQNGFTCYIDAPSNNAVDKCTVVKVVAKDNDGNTVYKDTATYFIGTQEEHIQGITKAVKLVTTHSLSLALLWIMTIYLIMKQVST